MLLLDTHIVIWWLADDDRLPAGVRRQILDDQVPATVSVVTVWEIILKEATGKLRMPPDWLSVLARDFEILPLEIHHLLRLPSLPPLHRDPFDRVLVAQCLGEDAALATTDAALFAYPIRVLSS